jgi:hypothetical protein
VIQEREELRVPMPARAAADDLPGRHIHLALFIEREDKRVIRRTELEPDDVANLFDKIGGPPKA